MSTQASLVQPSLESLVSTHDATYREYATAIARGDMKGIEVAGKQLKMLGEQIGNAAESAVSSINAELNKVHSLTPEVQRRARDLTVEAANLGRLAREHIPSATMDAELEQSAERSRAAVSVSVAMFILFLTLAIAFLTGYYKPVVIIGLALIFLVYKPFSASFRWQELSKSLKYV